MKKKEKTKIKQKEKEKENLNAANMSNNKTLDDLRQTLIILSKVESQNNTLIKQIEKYESNIKYSLEQVENKLSLNSIELPKELSDEQITKDSSIMKRIDFLIEDWSINIDKAIQSLSQSKAGVKSASIEIDNRKRIVSNLTILYQQIKSDNTQRIVSIISLGEDISKKQNFLNKIKAFEYQYEDASDYLKFLYTLERSIKDLSSDDLSVIENSISGIFHNLKIIYMISKHKDPTKFGNLMEIMAQEICDKISSKIKMKEIFKNPSESIALLDQVIEIVKKWKQSYTDAKNRTKWDYPATNITGLTDYVQKVCVKLKSGLEKVKEYLKFLGPELKRVIGGSSDKIDKERDKVYKAYSLIENLTYPIFDKKYETTYNETFSKFDSSMKELENDTVKLIDETFEGELRSAESAYDLYINFGNLIKQEEIQQAMKKKYIKIIEKFINEVNTTSDIFEKNKLNPPISKAKPVVSGKIAWARLLYLKMKKPISKIFLDESNLNHNNNSEIIKYIDELKKKFIDLATKLKEYEKKIFDDWEKDCQENFLRYA